MRNRLTAICTLIGGWLFAQSTLYTNAHIHIGNGSGIENGQMLVENGDILWVGAANETPSNQADQTVDLSGKHLYPGFIAPATATGLVEVEAVRATVDFREVGNDNPNARAGIAFNTDSRILPTLIYNGILISQSTPQTGVFSGMSSVMRMQARNWEEAAIRMDDGMHVHWPNPMRFDRKKRKLVANDKYSKQVQHILETLDDAKAYLNGKRQPINLKLEAFNGIFGGDKRVYIYTNKPGAMVEAIDELKRRGVSYPVLVGAMDAHLISEYLVAEDVPVLLSRPHELPMHSDDPVDLPFKTPALLVNAGVTVGLSNMGRMPVMGNRNLPFMAGTAVTYGLDYEMAVATISGNTAKILGIDQRYGTLEPGKSATFFISTGDALDMSSMHIESAYIDGKPVDMANWQEQLFKKWDTIVR